MQRCAFCGSELPDDTRYCGQCGRAPIATLDAPTTFSSGQVRLVPKKEAEEEEERQHRAFLLDLSFSPGKGGQSSVGHMPTVQGTPQVGGAPMVQGAASSLSGAPAGSAVAQSAASPTPSSLGPPQTSQGGASIAPTAASAKLSMRSPHSPQKLHAPHPGRSASGRMIRSAPRWLHIALTGLVVIVASGIILALIGNHPNGGGTTPSRPRRITAFSIPTAGSTLITITAGPDGNLWFIERYANKIGRITPEGKISEFPAPTSDIEAITKGPDGNLWFTEYFRGIGRITPGGKISEFSIPGGPTGITLGPDHNLWFTRHDGMIGRITPSGIISEFPLPAGSASPTVITAGSDGNLWFIEPDGNKIGRIGAG